MNTSVRAKINTITNAWRASDLVIIGGAIDMGKAAFMALLAVNCARDNNMPIAIFSLVAPLSYITKQLKEYGNISGLPLHIDDTPLVDVDYLYAKVKYLSEVEGVRVVFINSLPLMLGKDVLKSLKLIAKELNITFVCLSDIMRFSARRLDSRPLISDLERMRLVEDVSQYADTILFIYRASYYGQADNNMAEIIIAKHYDDDSLDSIYLPFDNSKRVFIS